jgi:hypothetical protein
MITPVQTRRLAFAKYLLSVGTNQARQPEPLAHAAILSLHDATELFLQLAAEHLNVGKKDKTFLEYWTLLNPVVHPNGLPQGDAMKRLNTSRVALKHHGTFPSRLDLDDYVTTTNRFFEDSTPLVFGVSLESISLVSFVGCEEARNQLEAAIDALKSGDLKKGFESCALAFDSIVLDYEAGKTSRRHRSPFFFGREVRGLSSSIPASRIPYLKDFAESVNESLEAMRGAIKILSLGLDFRRFSRFEMLTPVVNHFVRGDRDFRWYGIGEPKVSQSSADLSFCVDFTIESALRLQEFDYESATS